MLFQKKLYCYKYGMIGLFFFFILKAQAQRSSESTRYNFVLLEQKIKGWINNGYYSGASVVIAKDNKTIYKRYFGNYKPETVAFIASAGKWLAAATITSLVDEGKLSWSDKVKKWLPEFTDVKGEATLAQLMSHTAGFPDYQPADKPIDIYQTLKASVAATAALPADTLPGTKFKYGGLAMNVAGRMAELATGKDWEMIFQEKIAIPLGMNATHFTPVDSAGGHAPMLGGGARSTLDDYAKFLSMIFNKGSFKGKSILSEKAIAVMQADHVLNANIPKDNFVHAVRHSNRNDIYGLGEWREETDKVGNAIIISSPSWAGAYPWIDKKNGVYGFFLTHIREAGNVFNSFLSSPVLALMVRNIVNKKNRK